MTVEAELAALRAEVRRLRAENTRLEAVLRLTPAESGAPGPAQTAVAVPRRGMVGADSPPGEKVAFFAGVFAARSDDWRVLRAWPGKEVAEVHDYVDMGVPVLAASVGKRARGYLSLGFPTHEERGGEEFVTGNSIPRRGRAVGRDGATAVAALHRRR